MLQALAFLAWIAFLALARATDVGNRIGGRFPPRVQAMVREWHPRLQLSGYVVLVIAWAWLSRHTSDWGRILVGLAQSTSLPQSGLLPFPLWIRLGLAAVIAVVGGLFGQAWTIPVAVVAAQPIFWSIGLTTLLAVVPLATGRAERLRIGSIRPS